MTDPVQIEGVRLFEFGLAGLLINGVGLFLFGKRNSRFTNHGFPHGSGTTAWQPDVSVASLHAPGHQSNVQVVAAAVRCASRAASLSSCASPCVSQAVYLHVLSDAFSSVAVLCNALLVRWQGWLWVDTLQSLAVAAVTLYR